MWMHDVQVGLAALTKKDYLETLLSEINQPELVFFKDLLRSVFVIGILYIYLFYRFNKED